MSREAEPVQGVLEGFATIGVIIAVGTLLAHVGVLDLRTY
jgi:hypothetical protein